MSDQVYQSQNQKYLPSVNFNIWVREGNVQTIPNNTTITCAYNTPVIVSDTTDFTMNVATGVITINKSGIYSIFAAVVLTDASSPSANDVDAGLTFLYVGDTTRTLANQSFRIPHRGGTGGSDVFTCPINLTSYCQEGSTIALRVNNFAPTNLNIVSDVNTQFMIQRIA